LCAAAAVLVAAAAAVAVLLQLLLLVLVLLALILVVFVLVHAAKHLQMHRRRTQSHRCGISSAVVRSNYNSKHKYSDSVSKQQKVVAYR
jgi:fatty acid desaturase